jgi:hypothetical protein
VSRGSLRERGERNLFTLSLSKVVPRMVLSPLSARSCTTHNVRYIIGLLFDIRIKRFTHLAAVVLTGVSVDPKEGDLSVIKTQRRGEMGVILG